MVNPKTKPTPKMFIPNTPSPDYKVKEVKLNEYEGFKRLDKMLERRDQNPNLGLAGDQRKTRICMMCSSYTDSYNIVRSEVYGITVEELKQKLLKFGQPMPFDQRFHWACVCDDCKELAIKIDRQKGYRE